MKHTRVRYDYLFRWLGKRKLTPQKAEEFILYLREKGLRNSSINSYIRVINLIDIYERENRKDLNLLKGISYFPKQKRVPTILSIDEIESILSINIDYKYLKKDYLLDSERLNQNYKMAIWMLAATGCRFDEMASLRKGNLRLGLMKGFVIFKDTKTLEDRQVPLPPDYVEKLKEFVKKKKPNDLCFTSATGHKIVEQTFNPELRRRVELANITKHTYAHCFRNSFIMEHIKRGTQHLTISKLVGHRDPKTTLGYTNYTYDILEKGAENHPLFSRSLNIEKIINKIAETIEDWPIKDDARFERRVEKRQNSLLVEVYAK